MSIRKCRNSINALAEVLLPIRSNFILITIIMAGALDIQRRIKSIKNTKKVTKAMEIVSAAKMKKAIKQVTDLRPYAVAMQTMFASVAPNVSSSHPLLVQRAVNRVLLVVIASNKGLCGGFNTQIAKSVQGALDQLDSDGINKEMISAITIGRKADAMVKRAGIDPIATFPELNYSPDSVACRPVVKMVTKGYSEGEFDKVMIVYTDFISPITQEQRVRQVLPVSQDDLKKQLDEMADSAESAGIAPSREYVVEPSNDEAITALMPRVLESQILHALYESNASKESSRMMAMNNATEAAGEIIDDLTLAYNKMRQAKITQEISEISAGSAALE